MKCQYRVYRRMLKWSSVKIFWNKYYMKISRHEYYFISWHSFFFATLWKFKKKSFRLFPSFPFSLSLFSCNAALDSAFNVCKINNSTSATDSMMLTGQDILPSITTVDVGIGESFAALWTMIIGARTVFYLALRYLNKPWNLVYIILYINSVNGI